MMRISFHSAYTWKVARKNRDQDHIKLYLFFFQGKKFTPTPATLEIKIKEVLNPFLVAFHGHWRTKSAGLD